MGPAIFIESPRGDRRLPPEEAGLCSHRRGSDGTGELARCVRLQAVEDLYWCGSKPPLSSRPAVSVWNIVLQMGALPVDPITRMILRHI